MADQDSLQILIELLANTAGADKVQAALDKTKESVGDLNTHLPEGSELWAKYKNQLSDVNHEGERVEASHRAIHLLLEKLGLPAHELGLLLHGMFNEATVSVVSLAIAWEIWNKRMEEGVKVLSGFQLPDLSEHVKQLSMAEEAQRKYNEALSATVEAYNSIEAASDRRIKKLQEELKLQKAIAEAAGASSAQIDQMDIEEGKKEIAEKLKRKADLEKSSGEKRKRAEDIHIASKEEDDANIQDAKAQADAAKKGKEEANQRLELIERLRSGGKSPVDIATFFTRYGTSTGTEATAMEMRNIDQANEAIARYQKLITRAPGRDALREQRQKLIEEAGKEQGQAYILSQSIGEDQSSLRNREANGAAGRFKADQERAQKDIAEIQRMAGKPVVDAQEIRNAKAAVDDLHKTLTDMHSLLGALHQLGVPIQQLETRMKAVENQLLRQGRPVQ